MPADLLRPMELQDARAALVAAEAAGVVDGLAGLLVAAALPARAAHDSDAGADADGDVARRPPFADGDDPVEEVLERLGDAGVPAADADPVELVLGQGDDGGAAVVAGLAHVEVEVALVRRVERVQPAD
jgi:hypothetical protein